MAEMNASIITAGNVLGSMKRRRFWTRSGVALGEPHTGLMIAAARREFVNTVARCPGGSTGERRLIIGRYNPGKKKMPMRALITRAICPPLTRRDARADIFYRRVALVSPAEKDRGGPFRGLSSVTNEETRGIARAIRIAVN